MARIVVQVDEKGVSTADKNLGKLQKTGVKTEKQLTKLETTSKSFGKNAAAAIAAVDGPLGGISSRVSSVTTLFTSGTSAVTGFAASVAAVSFATVQGIRELDKYETSLVRTEAILNATGNAAGFTAEQLQRQADSLALATLTSTEEVQKAQAQLLTFNRVAGDVFTNAIELSQDLAETGFGSVSSNAVQLGKALQDPIKGISALTRVGISFNDTQKETIKLAVESGDTLAAQAVIIQALKEQVGGAGSSVAADSLAGKLDTAGQRWDEFTRALAEESGSLVTAKDGVGLLTSALEALTKSITGGTLEEQLSKVTIEIERQQSTVDKLRESSQRLEDVNVKSLGSSQALAVVTAKRATATADLAAQEAILAEQISQRDAIQGQLGSRESAEIEARETSIKKQAELEAEASAARASKIASDASDAAAKEAEKLAAQEARQQESIDRQVEAVRVGLLTENQLRLENALNEAELVGQSTLALEEQTEILSGIWGAYYDDIAIKAKESAEERQKEEEKLAKQQKRIEKQQRRDSLSALDGATSDLETALGEQSVIFKAAATTNAAIKTYEAANSAYAALASIPIVGPGLGIAAAGAAIGAGLANVAKINSARQQGGQVNAGDTVMTGERGRELFVPNTAGRIVSNSDLRSGSGSPQVNVYITNNSSNSQVTQSEDAQGNQYVRIDDLDGLIGASLSNPNSEGFNGLSATANLVRN